MLLWNEENFLKIYLVDNAHMLRIRMQITIFKKYIRKKEKYIYST